MHSPQQATIPLKDYAIIGDCRTAALISREGSIDWLCLPDFDSPSLFARLLDTERGGYFSITLAQLTHAERRYRPETAILETTLTSSTGRIRITDCMPLVPRARQQSQLQPLREIIRCVEVLEGNPVILVTLDARPNYARHQGRFKFRRGLGWVLRDRQFKLHLVTNAVLTDHDGILHGHIDATPSEPICFSLTYDRSPGVLMPIGEAMAARIAATQQWWHEWCAHSQYRGAWREQVMRSAITLRLMTFPQSGALLAAVTTSLPERPGGWMNWDYRFCWPRDSAVTLSAFIYIGMRAEVDAFFDWLMIAANTTRPYLKNIYDIYGRHRIRERLLPWLSGYGNARPVRIGNAVTKQKQHDVYGEVMMALENWIADYGAPSHYQRKLIEGFGRAVAHEWREPDNSIWEIRDEARHYTYSKVMSWHVFDSLVRLHSQGYIDGPIAMYRRERDALRDLIEREAFNPQRQCYVATFGGDTVDASLLLLPRCGFVDYNDPRMIHTWEAIRADLEQDGLIRRYPPGFGGSEPEEGAFIICNFWAVSYLAGRGEHAQACARLTTLFTLANDVGLYNESVAFASHAALGNMPQAFSHAGLINAVVQMEQILAEHSLAEAA